MQMYGFLGQEPLTLIKKGLHSAVDSGTILIHYILKSYALVDAVPSS